MFLILCYATLDNILKIINTDDFIDSPKQLPDSLLSNILSQNKFHCTYYRLIDLECLPIVVCFVLGITVKYTQLRTSNSQLFFALALGLLCFALILKSYTLETHQLL